MKDTLLFTKEQLPLARRLAEGIVLKLIDNENKTIVATLSGLSGTGKTEVGIRAKEILRDIEIFTKVLSLDGFYLPKHEQNRVDTDFDSVGKDEIDWDALQRAVGNWTHSHSHNIILIEGLYAGYLESDISFYIDQDYTESYEFRLHRGKEDPNSKHRQIVLGKEMADIVPLKEKSDIILTY